MCEVFIQWPFFCFSLIWHNLFTPSKHFVSNHLLSIILIIWAYSYSFSLHTSSFWAYSHSYLAPPLYYSWDGNALWNLGLLSGGCFSECHGRVLRPSFLWDRLSSSKFLSFPLPFLSALMFLRFSRWTSFPRSLLNIPKIQWGRIILLVRTWMFLGPVWAIRIIQLSCFLIFLSQKLFLLSILWVFTLCTWGLGFR